MTDFSIPEVDLKAQPAVSHAVHRPSLGSSSPDQNYLHSKHTREADRETDLDAQPEVPGGVGHIHPPEHGLAPELTPAQGKQGNSLLETQDQTVNPNPATEKSPGDGLPQEHSPDQEPQDIRVTGDFDDCANAFWTLYGKEAKNHDEARVRTLKDDMDGVLIFAGLYSAVLTAFLIDSKQSLHISRQLSSLTPEVAIPSTLPVPYPDFHPLPSAIRVNVFWFMALVFSLSTALLATLVQQWVRGYMHVLQRYSNPLKSARLRQYLSDGSEGWYMPVVAEALPGLLHVSLFLFFTGLADYVLNINTTVGTGTVLLIGVSGLLYIFTTFAPVIYPQSPYQNSFSGLIWYLFQKVHGRGYKDRASSGVLKPVNSNMAKGQMQLAMEETKERKERDERAIRWMVSNMTEDAEMELFVIAMPGSFNTEWGLEVWKGVSEAMEIEKTASWNEVSARPLADVNLPITMSTADRPSPRVRTARNPFGSIIRVARTYTFGRSSSDAMALQPVSHPPAIASSSVPAIQGENVVRELSRRVAHLLETCKHRGLFTSEELWRKRTRASIESAALLVYYANADLGWFGDNTKLLGEIGSVEKTRESSLAGLDQSFVICWTCLSIMAVRAVLSSSDFSVVLGVYSRSAYSLEMPKGIDDTGDGRTLSYAQRLDEMFEKVHECLMELYSAVSTETNVTEEQVIEVLRNHEPLISELERIKTEADNTHGIDDLILIFQIMLDRSTYKIIRLLPDAQFDEPFTEPVSFSQAVEWFIDPVKLRFILPIQRLKSLCSLCPTLLRILEGGNTEGPEEMLKSLKGMERLRFWPKNLLQRQMWRVNDLRDSGGFGLTVELFFLALKLPLTKSRSRDRRSALYIGTFRAITSDWSKYKKSPGTLRIILDLVASRDSVIFTYAPYITDELLALLGNMTEGETGPHIDDAVRQLETANWYGLSKFEEYRAKALKVISRSRAPMLPPS